MSELDPDPEALRVAINRRLEANIAANAQRLDRAPASPLASQTILPGSLAILSSRPVLGDGLEIAFSGRLEHESERSGFTDVPVSGRAVVLADGSVASAGFDSVHLARGRPLPRPPEAR